MCVVNTVLSDARPPLPSPRGRVSPMTTALAGSLAAMALLLPCAARAQSRPEDLANRSLEDLMKIPVTTASRTGEQALTAPGSMIVVTAADIARRGYRSLTDVLRDIPEFKVDLGGDQDYPVELTVRGTRGSSRVVVMLDGVRVTSPTNEPIPFFANYPVNGATQIEIALGSSSALYGADAFSAVVNIITMDATTHPGVTVAASAGQFGLQNYSGRLAQSFSRGSLVVSGQVYRDAGPDLSKFYPADFGRLQGQHTGVFNTIFGPMTSPTPVDPSFAAPSSAHAVHAVFSTSHLAIMAFQSRSRMSTTPAYSPDNGVYNAAAFTGNNLFVASATYRARVGAVETSSTATYSRHEMDPQSGYWNVYSNMTKSYKYAYGSMLQLGQQGTWKPRAGLTVVAGGEVARLFAIPQTADLNAPIVSRDLPGTLLGTNIVEAFNKIRYSNAGVFGQVAQVWSPRVALTVGGRLDYNTRYDATFNPRAALVLQPRAGMTVKLLAGTAYLAPSPFQAYSHWGQFTTSDGGATYQSSYWHVPNPDLQPQHRTTYEATLHEELTPRMSFGASAFASRVTNVIDESDPRQGRPGVFMGWPVAYIDSAVNDGTETTYGTSLRLDYLRQWSAGRLAARAALALVGGHTYDIDDDLRFELGVVSPVQFRGGVDLDLGRWTFAPRLASMSRQRLIATTGDAATLQRRTLPGYTTVDLSVRRHGLPGGATAFLLIENAMDARYRNINARAYTNPEELIGAPQNPRRVAVGLEFRIK